MAISVQQAQGLIISATLEKFTEIRRPFNHFKLDFPDKLYDSRIIPYEIKRDNDIVAFDVLRGTNGNDNKATVFTAHGLIPPEYHEKFAVNSLSSYERTFGIDAASASAARRAAVAEEIAEEMIKLENKVIRSEEIQCSQLYETGTITLVNNDSVVYARQALSKVDLGADGYWNNVDAPIATQLQTAGEWLDNEGGADTNFLDMTMSGTAWVVFQESNFFKQKALFVQASEVREIWPKRNTSGATFQGRLSAGAYTYNVYTYDKTYTNASSVRTRFWPATKAVITPTKGMNANMCYGAVDKIIKSSGAKGMSAQTIVSGKAKRYLWDTIDKEGRTQKIHMSTSPIARLVSIDQVYTMTVTGDINPEVG